jgi:hypothetical protein
MKHTFSHHMHSTIIPVTSRAMAHSFLSPHVQWHTHSYHLTCNGTLIPVTSRAMAQSFLSANAHTLIPITLRAMAH